MSNILNQKEEVLKVEMTKHGRKMFGLGFFKPSYFSFFDDSVIYDSSYYTIISESVNNIQDRILYNSLCFSSMDLLSVDKKEPLGRSNPFSDYVPSWQVVALNGKLDYKKEQSSYYKKYFEFQNMKCNLSFQDKVISKNNIKIESDYILLDVQELNVGIDRENFEVELLYYDPITSGSSGVIEKKLLFISPKNNIIDDIIYDEEELPSKYFDVDFDQNHASYFYDLLVDEEIDTDYIINAGKGVYETITGFTSGITSVFTTRSKTPITPGLPPGRDPNEDRDGLTGPNIGPGLNDGDRIKLGPNGEITVINPDRLSSLSLDREKDYSDPDSCKVECCDT